MSEQLYDQFIDLQDAIDRVTALRSTVNFHRESERVSLEAVAGRVLAEPIDAPFDLPAESRATMDGFAFDATEGYPYTLIDETVFPEDEPPSLGSGEAIRIATGAPLPASANVVCKREDATIENGRLEGPSLSPGTYVTERGSNVTEGERLFDAGERLAPRDALLLADLGFEEVSVWTPLEVAILATGSEIHEGRQRDLDSPMLANLVTSWGHKPTYEGTVPDEYDQVVSRIDELARTADVVLTTGGTSVGKKDYVINALDDLGEILFHAVRLRPGKPIAVAHLEQQEAVVFAIPGKPVGAHAVTSLVARPFFTGDSDRPSSSATMARTVDISRAGFIYAIPVLLEDDNNDTKTKAQAQAMPLGHTDSPLKLYDRTFDPSVLSSSTRATRADGFVLTDGLLEAGSDVAVIPYSAVER